MTYSHGHDIEKIEVKMFPEFDFSLNIQLLVARDLNFLSGT